MNLSFLGPLHPQIVHTPVALLIFSALFAVLGRLLDRDWLRKAALTMLVIGFVGAWLAVQSGRPAHRVPEHEQGVPEAEIDEHAEMGQRTVYLAGGALVAIAIASRLTGTAAGVFSGLGLVLQLAAAAMVGITGYHGGKLVYEHGANVHVDGVLVKSAHATEHGESRGAEPGKGGAAGHEPEAGAKPPEAGGSPD
jgi:uncharacterized membrane protein